MTARRLYRVCGDCAGALVEAGGVIVPSTMPLGTGCETHPRLAATVTVQADDSCRPHASEAPERGANDDDTEDEDAPPPPIDAAPSGIGPVTELAARFVASWGHKSEGAKGDEFMVRHAVVVARRILAETGGR